MSESESRSELLRKEGNQHFTDAHKANLPLPKKQKALRDAMHSYQSARSLAEDDDELSSAERNISICAFQLAELLWPDAKAEFPDSLWELIRVGIASFLGALSDGRDSKEDSWMASLLTLNSTAATSLM